MPFSSSRVSGSTRPIFFTLYLSAAVLPALGHSDDDGGKKGYNFDKQDDDDKGKNSWKDDNWDDSAQGDGKWHDSSSASQDDGQWHDNASSTTDWSASESPTASATTSKWHKSDWSSITSTSSTTSNPTSSSLGLPTQPPNTPQHRHISPVAIAVPLAICGLIGFIALLVCGKRRSATTRSAPGPSDIEKEMQSLIWRQQSLLSQKSEGLTISKRVEDVPTLGYGSADRQRQDGHRDELYGDARHHSDSVYTAHELAQQESDQPRESERQYFERDSNLHRPKSERLRDHGRQYSRPHRDLEQEHSTRHELEQQSERHRALDNYAYYHSHRDSRPGRWRDPPARHKGTGSSFSDPTSRSDTCITPAHSRDTHDYFTHLPSRSRGSRHYLDMSRSGSSGTYDYYPRHSSGGIAMDCNCSRCNRPRDIKPDLLPIRGPSLTSRTVTDPGSLFNPYPRAKDPFDYRPHSLRSTHHYPHMERQHSGSSRATDGLYDTLRAALSQ